MITSPKSFTLKKRLYFHNGVIYCRFRINGKLYRKTTATIDVKLAQIRAFAIWRELVGETDEHLMFYGQRSSYPHLSAILEVYKKEVPKMGKSSLQTCAENARTLENMLNFVGLQDPSIDKITPEMLSKWRSMRYEDLDKSLTDDDELDINTTLNSIHRKARSVFGRVALEIYEKHRLKIPPCIEKFCKVPNLRQADSTFTPIPPEIDEAIKSLANYTICKHAGIEIQEPKTKYTLPTLQTAISVELARYCALTAKEIVAIRWNWIEKRGDRLVINIRYRKASENQGEQFISKWNKKYGEISLDKDRLERWQMALKPKANTDKIISTSQEVKDAATWVAQFLPDRIKRLHELRKQAGSEVLTKTGSMAKAAKFVRDSITTTEKYYANFLEAGIAL